MELIASTLLQHGSLPERYIDALEVTSDENIGRFVNILQSMVIWINAWNMNVACEDEVPPPCNIHWNT